MRWLLLVLLSASVLAAAMANVPLAATGLRSDTPVYLPDCPIAPLATVRRSYPGAIRWNDVSFSRYSDTVLAGTALVRRVTMTDCKFGTSSGGLVSLSSFCASATARAKLWQGRALAPQSLVKLQSVKIGSGGYMRYRAGEGAVLVFRTRHAYFEAGVTPTYSRQDLGPFLAVARAATRYRC